MKRENWQKVKEIFNAALEIPAKSREKFLSEACAGDEFLRRDVEILLNSFEENFLEKPAVQQVADVIVEKEIAFKTGDRLGEYQIVEPLGAGGQGAVFLARDLQLNRRVAIKFLPPESAQNSQANRRFQREARAAAALSHPNICSIHKIGAEAGHEFIVMQFVEGETLSERLKKVKLDLKSALDIAIQIADALAEAHANGVIHRDIKPANIVVSAKNQVTVLDFGLAKRIVRTEFKAESSITKSGMVMGTVAYMSPEQARGEKTDGRTDIWSLGVCLYEMMMGKNPFLRESAAETFAAILADEPALNDFPLPLRQIVSKTLRKNVNERYAKAKDLLADLREFQSELSFEEQLRSHELSFEKPSAKLLFRGWRPAVFAGFILVIIFVSVWVYRQNRNLNWARDNVKKVEELARADKIFEAYDLALQIQKYLPDDETLNKLMPAIADNLTVKTEPTGAKVYLKRFQPDKQGNFPKRELIDETPFENIQIARGQYLLDIEKDGFTKFTRSISGRLPHYTTDLIAVPPLEISVKLLETDKNPEKMVYIPAGDYKLVGYTRPSGNAVRLGDFFIDQYEVSNAEFKEFITAGGYAKKEFWQFPFRQNGREISFAQAVKDFKDRTGLSAPRSWTNQSFPVGKADFPVTDISWYEAAAYAAFREKSLPTVFQWEKAARDGKFDEGYNSMPWGLSRDADSTEFLANFGSQDTKTIKSFEFGASPYGCLNMAGNAAEWLLNRRGENVLTAGGAFDDLAYAFGDYGEYPPFYSSNRIGFRLVKNFPANERGAEELPPVEILSFPVSSARDFKIWLTHYAYDKTSLEAKIIEKTETDSWTREKISFVGANREKVLAYLYLPKNFPRPLQVVHWIPAADVPLGFSSLPHSVEVFLAPIIKQGRAVFAVVLEGYNERPLPANYEFPKNGSIAFRNINVNRVTDWRRGLDYLETRQDIEPKRIAFLGLSNGANQGLLLTAIDNRYVSAAFVGAGLAADWKTYQPETNPANFAPHIFTPKLFLKGRYDEAHPLITEGEPLFKLLKEPKRPVIVKSGHIPPPEIFAPILNNWLDETMGKAAGK